MRIILFILGVIIRLPFGVNSNHLIVIGKNSWLTHSSGDKPDECVVDTSTSGAASNEHGDEIGVQCCSFDGSSGSRQNLVGGEDYNGYIDCLKGVTYDVAKSACESQGDRLCTAEEVRDNVASGSGCNHDGRHVWTADPCGQHYIVIGKQANEGSKTDECTDDSSTDGVASNSYGTDIAVQCCSLDGSSSYRQNVVGGVDTESHSGCLQGVSYEEARNSCEAAGDRLCTAAEVKDNVGSGSGCYHDHRHVWTSDPCGATNGLDSYFADRYAPYIRFDNDADSGSNGFPSAYNHGNGREQDLNLNSAISGIPTYYHIYHDYEGKPVSIGYFWYYEFQTACLYDGIDALDGMPSQLKSAITSVLDDTDIMDPKDIGQHDDDLEKVFVNLNSDYSIKSVTYHQHNGKYTVTSSSNKLAFYLSTHAHVYAGLVSHGSYHNQLSNVGGCGYFHDYRDGGIKRLTSQNLQEAYFRNYWEEREDGWEANGFCGSTGCNWASCETSSEVSSNPDDCTPLDCNNWRTSCLIWGVSTTVKTAADLAEVKDKYFWFDYTGHPDCDCVNIPIIGRTCKGENIEGKVCTPDFSGIPPISPELKPVIHFDHPYPNDVIMIWLNWKTMIIATLMVLLLTNCICNITYCYKKNNKNKVHYKSVRFNSETEEEEFDEEEVINIVE